MALINNYYVFVKKETVKRDVTASEHPVEKGIDITDNVKRNAMIISIEGEIVGKNAINVKNSIEKLHQKGKIIKYVGSNTLGNALLKSFNTDHTNEVSGGCFFSAEIKEVRTANSAYKATSPKKKTVSSGQQQVTEKKKTTTRYYTVKSGDCLWSIAKSYYGNGALYTKIYKANKKKIKNPNIIQKGWKLVIPY